MTFAGCAAHATPMHRGRSTDNRASVADSCVADAGFWPAPFLLFPARRCDGVATHAFFRIVCPMAQYVFTMNRVSKVVPPKRTILKDISLSFFPGAKIGVLGLNGSGKSTLLRIMAGIDTEIEGEAIPMPGLSIGHLPQEPQLNPEHTVRQEVELALGEVNAARARLEEIYAA